MIYCGKVEFGQISRSFSLNSGAIRLKRPKNLTQIGFPSLRSVKSDRLLDQGSRSASAHHASRVGSFEKTLLFRQNGRRGDGARLACTAFENS